jgi:hypothetical protein
MPIVKEAAVKRAIANVGAFGDTDVFPFPFENWFLKSDPSAALEIVLDIDKRFDELITTFPPQFESILAPAGYTGFRWVTQIDPFWNLYLLSMLITAAPGIEAARMPHDVVHSYRFNPGKSDSIFKPDIGWASFMRKSHELSLQYKHVVATDISEFYRRINHHRVENALHHVIKNQIPKRTIEILSVFSNNSSYGLPIGGPAARLISEITLNQIDKLLNASGIKFLRFADDFHIFTDSLNESYTALQFLSQSLITNQGLTLQKSKTRIMTSVEFQNSFPKHLLPDSPKPESDLESETIKLLKLSLSFDPYAQNAVENYDALKNELGQIDIVGLLAAETQKTQINLSVSRKIVSSIKHLQSEQRVAAIKTLIENKEQFFPILSLVLIMIKDVMVDSDAETKNKIAESVRSAVKSGSHVFGLDLHKAYVVRILSESGSEEDMLMLSSFFGNSSPIVRRDIILSYAKHKYWYLLSDLKSKYSNLTPWEQRAFFVSSYSLGDEGHHWRGKIKLPTKLVDEGIRKWCGTLKTSDDFLVKL